MAINLETLGIQKLTVPERLSLIEQIWATLPEQVDLAEIPEWHLGELSLRRSNTLAHPQAKPWRGVLAELEGH